MAPPRLRRESGFCRFAAINTDPNNECPDEGSTSCKRTGTCNGYPRRVLTMQRQLRFGPASPQSTARVIAST